jgi:hypothetical protein
MPALDVQALGTQMLGAALPILKQGAADIETFAKNEFAMIAQRIVSIGEQLAEGKAGLPGGINEQQAQLLFDMQKNASRSALITAEGLGLVTAEAAINAALDVVRAAVNTALGIALF